MYKKPAGSRMVVGVCEWHEAAAFLDMSAHTLQGFSDK